MKLNELKNNEGATQYKTRVGRGIGCGKGKTCGRGYKGQKSREGVSSLGEGGQTPLFRRLPKRGFHNHSTKLVEVINLSVLEDFVSRKVLGAKINRETLEKAGLLKKRGSLVKILAKGEIKTKVEVEADFASEAAIKAIEKAGGKIILPAKEEKAA